MRGEDYDIDALPDTSEETPPRAWGRPLDPKWGHSSRRNTPTCVGKTNNKLAFATIKEKHPHVRGEDLMAIAQHHLFSETPPRAWGRHGNALRL